MSARIVRRGWHFTRFTARDVKEATGETWGVMLAIDPRGFEMLVGRWQIDYLRKPFRLDGDR